MGFPESGRVTAGRSGDLRVTLPDGFELLGLVLVTLVFLEAPDEEPDSPLRAWASAEDSNAANANTAKIAANAVLTVLIIVQFFKD